MSNTIFKVDEIKNRMGEVTYQVCGASNKVNYFLGIWDLYTKKNNTLDEAIEHIKKTLQVRDRITKNSI